MECNTHDKNRTIIVSIIDKATGIKAAMNIGGLPPSDTDTPTGDKVIKFNNAALEQDIRGRIYKKTADITENDIKDITDIYIGKNYTDLSGIENLKNLMRIDIIDCKINNLTPLKQLPNLKQLKYAVSTNTDVKILTELTSLTFLDLHGSKINDGDLSLIKKALPKCFIIH